MQTLTIQIKNSKALQILRDLENVDLIKILKTLSGQRSKSKLKTLLDKQKADSKEFLSMAGLWEDREITLSDIRNKAWPKRK